jgi:hypothetical protein
MQIVTEIIRENLSPSEVMALRQAESFGECESPTQPVGGD